MTEFESVDYFTHPSVVPDPYPHFDYLRSKCPVSREPHQSVLAVTGHQEARAVYKDPAFSACVSVVGPFAGLPFELKGDDISALLEQHRAQMPMSEHIVTRRWVNGKIRCSVRPRRFPCCSTRKRKTVERIAI